MCFSQLTAESKGAVAAAVASSRAALAGYLSGLAMFWALAAAPVLAQGGSAETQPTSTSPGPSSPDYHLTLTPPPDPQEILLATPSTNPEFIPHSDANIELSLREAHAQPAGILPYGPVSLIDPSWKAATDGLQSKLHLSLGMEMENVFQAATGGSGTRNAGGGYASIFGKWRLIGTSDGENNGYLKFKADYQWQMGTQAPSALGGQIGSLWKTTDGFGENPPAVTQLYWEQQFSNRALILAIGKIDATNYYVENLLASDKQFFMNAAFSGIPAVAAPGNGLGMNAKLSPFPWLYLTAGFQDQQGNKTTPGFNTFFGDFDLFSSAEIGFTPKIPGLGQGNYRFTLWHADSVPGKSLPSDHGFAISCDQAITPNLYPFLRYEYDRGQLTGIRQLLTAGIAYQGALLSKQDVCGLALAWGQPAMPNLRQQCAVEAFYRVQLSPANQLSIGYQMIINPANAPHDEMEGVFWTRFRILF